MTPEPLPHKGRAVLDPLPSSAYPPFAEPITYATEPPVPFHVPLPWRVVGWSLDVAYVAVDYAAETGAALVDRARKLRARIDTLSADAWSHGEPLVDRPPEGHR